MAQEKSQVCLSGLRSAACGALGTMGVGPALSAESKAGIIAMLTAAVKDSEEHVRSAACGALGTVGVDPALSAEEKAGIVAMLTAAVKDSEEHVRSTACGALGAMGAGLQRAVPLA